MPIASITKEENLEVLLQDTRDFCDRNKERYDRFFGEEANDLQIHDVVGFFDSFNDMIPADVVVEALQDMDETKINELLARAQASVNAVVLKDRWFSAYSDWEDSTSPSRWGPDSLSSRTWERRHP